MKIISEEKYENLKTKNLVIAKKRKVRERIFLMCIFILQKYLIYAKI